MLNDTDTMLQSFGQAGQLDIDPREWLTLSRNIRGREYIGSNFKKTPRPERFKRYDGPYLRLKTSMASPGHSNDKRNDKLPDFALLEQLLLLSHSVTSIKFYGYQSEMVWTNPSAGACYPVEIYVIVRELEGMNPGVYHYSALNSSLNYLSDPQLAFLLKESLLQTDVEAPFHLVFTAMSWRSCWKYSLRGYRFAMIDAGHILTNFQLVLNALNLPFSTYLHCRVPYMKTLLNLDQLEEPIALISIGSPKGAVPVVPTTGGNYTGSLTKSRSISLEEHHADHFDWSPIFRYQKLLDSTASVPDACWLSSYKLPSTWRSMETVSNLIFKRRSCSAFLPVAVTSETVIELLDELNGCGLPIEVYGIVHAIEQWEPGLYRLSGRERRLIQPGNYRALSTELCLFQEFVQDAAVVLFFTIRTDVQPAELPLLLQKRMIEAGMLGQIAYLKSRELNLGYSAVGGYYDEEIRDLFGLSAHDEVIYAGVLGKEDTHSAFKVKKDRYDLNKPKQGEANAMHKEDSEIRIIERLEESARRHYDRTAICYGEHSYTYGEFWEKIKAYASRFEQEIPQQYPVGIYMKNHPHYLFAYYGLLMKGYIPMLIDHTFTQDEVDYIRSNYHVGTIVTLNEENEVDIRVYGDEYPDFDPDQFVNVATCRFSSGTTGMPKCLMFTYSAVMNAGMNWAKASGVSESDRILCTALFHNGLAFNTSMLSAFLNGATLIINKQITPRSLWETVQREKATILVAFPVVFDMLNKSKYCDREHPLRLAISSSALLNYMVKHAFMEKTGLVICDYYGIVEAGPATFNNGEQLDSLGKPIDGVQLRIVDDEGKEILSDQPGTLQIKTSSMAKGYYNMPYALSELITPDGYYHTSDRAFIRRGYLFVTGRTNDMINVAGKKVDPSEIENMIRMIEGVSDTAVVGVMNPSLTSEYPVAFVVAENDAEIDAKIIVRHCQQMLAPFKLPQKIIFTDAIPRSGVGKIKRQELIERLQEQAEEALS